MIFNFITSIKIIILLTLTWLCSFNLLIGQNAFSTSAGARGIGMGNASLTYQDIHSVFNNQAGLAHLKGFSATTFVENRFLLEELQLVSIGIATPTNSGTVGLMVQYFGFDQYNEQKIGLNYSRVLFDKLAIGAQFDVLNTNIAEYGNNTAMTFEVGLQYEIFKNITAGVHIYNPIRAAITPDDKLPSILQIGLTYSPANYFMLSASIEKDTDLPYNFRAGLEYFLLDKIYFRAGVNTNPSRLSFGLGYALNRIQLNAAASYHEILGFSPSFGVSFMPNEMKDK